MVAYEIVVLKLTLEQRRNFFYLHFCG